jgi:hypothetical protein
MQPPACQKNENCEGIEFHPRLGQCAGMSPERASGGDLAHLAGRGNHPSYHADRASRDPDRHEATFRAVGACRL